MEKIRKYKKSVIFMITVSVVMIQSLLYWRIWNIFYFPGLVAPFYEKGTLLLVLVYVVLLSTFSTLYGGFKVGYYRVSDIIYSQILSLVFVNIITYMQLSLIARKMLNIKGIVIMFMLQIIIVIVWAYLSNKIYLKFNPAMKIAVVYGNNDVDRLIKKMQSRPDKYNIQLMIKADNDLDTIISEVLEYDAVVIYDVESSIRNRIVKQCYEHSIRAYITPKISDIIVGSADSLHLFDTPLFVCKNRGLSYEQTLAKRVMDVSISLILIILTSPFMIVTAILIKLYDRGPVLFKQDRVTLDNRVFSIYKFRSMIVDAEKDGVPRLAKVNDDRITPIGKFIRAVRMDELPQLFNILKGDMSVVGPRPERPEIVYKYIEVMPEFKFRTKVKAGLTGYAQIMGKYNTTPYDKLKLDLMYIEKYSFIMDLKLILMTIKVLFIPESTEGLSQNDLLSELNINKESEKVSSK